MSVSKPMQSINSLKILCHLCECTIFMFFLIFRAKILLHRSVPNIKPAKTSNDLPALIYVILDEQGCSKAVFQLSETSKDPNPAQTLKVDAALNDKTKLFTLLCYI